MCIHDAYICMNIHMYAHINVYVIQQGDIGDVFYLLEEGVVDVFVQKKGESSMKVHMHVYVYI
jgi:CRP-like cAMP-binding protein